MEVAMKKMQDEVTEALCLLFSPNSIAADSSEHILHFERIDPLACFNSELYGVAVRNTDKSNSLPRSTRQPREVDVSETSVEVAVWIGDLAEIGRCQR